MVETPLGRREAGIRLEERQLFPGWSDLEPELYEDEDGTRFVQVRGSNVASGIEKEFVPGASWTEDEFEELIGGVAVDLDQP